MADTMMTTTMIVMEDVEEDVLDTDTHTSRYILSTRFTLTTHITHHTIAHRITVHTATKINNAYTIPLVIKTAESLIEVLSF